jgi:hypothetical protein
VACAVPPQPQAATGFDPEAESAVQTITDQIMAQIKP